MFQQPSVCISPFIHYITEHVVSPVLLLIKKNAFSIYKLSVYAFVVMSHCLLVCSSACRYSYMIDNIILLITGTLHQRQISELRTKCHPLGSFAEMESINIADTAAELYSAVLVDTPLG